MGEKRLSEAAELFKRVRLENKLSQKELAQRINANGAYLSMIETGRKEPGKNILRRFAEEFSLDLDEVLKSKSHKVKVNEVIKENKKDKNVIDLEERKSKHKEREEIDLEGISNIYVLFASARKAYGYTLAKMAKELEVSASTLSNIENGKKIPNKSLILKFSNLFELPMKDCFKIAGYKNSETEQNKEENPEIKIIVDPQVQEKGRELNSNETSDEVTAEDDKSLKIQKQESSISDRLKMTFFNKTVGKSNVDMTDGKSRFCDLKPLTECIENENVEFELSFMIDKKENKKMNVTFSGNRVVFELNKA
ncbi:helix-turn-helix transcriptional regulator [Bacillus mexicanus]|uniref:helix-turn-helix domain-containing protein n=1 Tax=Bacillus mexicanus TaxID=2834415 RepID=UPI003D25F53A